MSEDTPPVVPAATPPVAPAPATPPEDTPSPTPKVEDVTLSKEAHDQLVRDAAIAKGNQRKASLYDKINKNGDGHFKPVAPVTPPSQEEQEAQASAEDRKAERGLLALAADPDYREVLDKDPTLRNLLIQNPLAVLPMYANDALDADDAVSLVKEALDKLKTPATPPVIPPKDTPPASETTPPTPPAGGINPTDSPVNDEVEAAKKLPNTENAISGMIGARIKQGASKPQE